MKNIEAGASDLNKLLVDVILSTTKAIPKKHRFGYYQLIIEHFEFYGCDNISVGVRLDAEFKRAFDSYYKEKRI